MSAIRLQIEATPGGANGKRSLHRSPPSVSSVLESDVNYSVEVLMSGGWLVVLTPQGRSRFAEGRLAWLCRYNGQIVSILNAKVIEDCAAKCGNAVQLLLCSVFAFQGKTSCHGNNVRF